MKSSMVSALAALGAGSQSFSLASLGERPGDYTVRITRPGYAVWEQGNIRVRDTGCHANQVELTARLQPAL